MRNPRPHDAAGDPFRPGALVAGKYLIERRLAEGGIGVIVVANHVELRRKVAIKYLQPKVLERAGVVERFKREAQLAACLRSEHVVRIFDVGVHDAGGPYIVMEYLEGEDLGAVVARGPLPRALAVDYVLQACDAIAEAHALGIVHRDLKPENLFLAKRGTGAPIVKILDFGISKASTKGDGAARLPRMTEEGERFGTPMYMSPEQLVSSTNVDARADIWALGVVLFELLTADSPFEGTTVGQLAASILSSPATSLVTRCPGATPALAKVILQCLEKEPERRFRNVAELAQELSPFGTSASEPRIENIRRLVREGGASIRPAASTEPTASGSFAALPLVRDAATLDSVVLPPSRSRRNAALVTILTAFVVMAGATLAAVRAGGPRVGNAVIGAPGRAALVMEAVAESASTPAPAPQPPPAPAPARVVEVPAEPSAAPARAHPVASTDPRPAPRPRAVTVDYSEFGERR